MLSIGLVESPNFSGTTSEQMRFGQISGRRLTKFPISFLLYISDAIFTEVAVGTHTVEEFIFLSAINLLTTSLFLSEAPT